MASQKPLHNRVDRKVLREQLAQSEQARTTVSFYKYWNIPDVQQFRDDLFRDWVGAGRTRAYLRSRRGHQRPNLGALRPV